MRKKDKQKMQTEPYVASKRRKPQPDSVWYPGTIRIPRRTMDERLSPHLLQLDITLQGYIAEALDERMRRDGIGGFFPDDWEEK